MSALRRPLAAQAYRISARNAGRIRVSHMRYISNSPTSLNTANTIAPEVKPKKKRRFLRTTLIYSTLLVLTSYAVGTAAAVNNERAHDWFTQNVPFAEEIVDFAESQGFVGGLARAGPGHAISPRRQRPTPSPSSEARPEPPKKHEKVEAFKSRVEERVKEKKERMKNIAAQLHGVTDKGESRELASTHISRTLPAPLPPAHYSSGVEDLVAEVKGVLKGDPIVFPPPAPEPENAASKEILHAPVAPRVEMEPPPEPPKGKQWYEGPPLPLGFEPPPGYAIKPPRKVPKSTAGLILVAPSVAEFTGSEPLLNELAGTVDNLAKYLEENPKVERSVNRILEVAKDDIVHLGQKIETIQKESKEQLDAHLEKQQKEYSLKLLEAELSAQDKLDSQDQDWRQYFEQERLSLLQKYQEKLDGELEAQKALINARLKEEVIAQGIELQRRWVRDVQLHVEEERGGRLAKLEGVATGLKKLERLTLDNANYLDENLRLHAVWSALRALTNATVDSPARKPFRDELHVLKSVASAAGTADDAMVSAIESLERTDAPDVGLEPLADLTAWFTTSVAPRVNSVSLVPEYGGGVLIHLASSLISSFRFRRTGLVEGDDALSRMARAEYYLNEKDLDSATRELNQLHGPAKELLADWLAAARRRLEVQQALEVVQAQATLSSLLVL